MKILTGKPALVKLADIYIGDRVRQSVGDVSDLTETISKSGLIHLPSIRKWDNPDYPYKLVAGERRIIACEQMGAKEIPVTILSKKQSEQADIIELIENECRRPFTPIEAILQTEKIHEAFVRENKKHSIEATSNNIGMSRAHTSTMLKHARLYRRASELTESFTEETIEAQPTEIQWDYILVKEFNKAKTLADIERAIRQHTLSHNTKALADETENKKFADELLIIMDEEDKEEESDSSIDQEMPLWKQNVIKRIEENYKVGDAIKLLEPFPNNYHSSCFWDIDPPYGVDYESFTSDSRYTDAKTFDEAMVYYKFTIQHMARISGPFSKAIIWHGAEPYIGAWVHNCIRDIGWSVDPIPFIWAKPTGHTRNPSQFLPRCYECASIAFAPESSYFGKGIGSNWLEYRSPGRKELRFHPNAKPLPLIKKLFNGVFEFGSVAAWFIPYGGGGAAIYHAACTASDYLHASDKEADYKYKLIENIKQDAFLKPDNLEDIESVMATPHDVSSVKAKDLDEL